MNRICKFCDEFMISHSNMSASSNKDDKCITSIYSTNWCVKIFWTSWVSGKKYLPSLSASNIAVLTVEQGNKRGKLIYFLTVCGNFIVWLISQYSVPPDLVHFRLRVSQLLIINTETCYSNACYIEYKKGISYIFEKYNLNGIWMIEISIYWPHRK